VGIGADFGGVVGVFVAVPAEAWREGEAEHEEAGVIFPEFGLFFVSVDEADSVEAPLAAVQEGSGIPHHISGKSSVGIYEGAIYPEAQVIAVGDGARSGVSGFSDEIGPAKATIYGEKRGATFIGGLGNSSAASQG
jgi:hypothetical protein